MNEEYGNMNELEKDVDERMPRHLEIMDAIHKTKNSLENLEILVSEFEGKPEKEKEPKDSVKQPVPSLSQVLSLVPKEIVIIRNRIDSVITRLHKALI